jgi:hypothetical protein
VLARNCQYYSPPLKVPLFAKRELKKKVSDLPAPARQHSQAGQAQS